ncbi:MAG TPA: IclR family transcriptional regulator [Paraburkholderia sp.]|nr:IclR family transcriptional regulator [Paraburkholderia sp.]
MPRKPNQPSVADLNAAEGGVAAVDRALSLLDVFTVGEPEVGLMELAQRTQMYKSTVLRLLASLEHAGLVVRTGDGLYRLGPAVARLHHVYASTFSLADVVMPVLRKLVKQTAESAAYYVPQGDRRVCLFRVDSPQPVRDHQNVGDLLPLDRGAGGRILSAYLGAKGAMYKQIRREQSVVLSGDRAPQLAGIGAPVFGANGKIEAALVCTMPSERMKLEFEPLVKRAAREITTLLGHPYPDAEA